MCPETDRDSKRLCAWGLTSSAGQTNCSSCPEGYECDGNNTRLCPPGTYGEPGQDGQDAACVTCPYGTVLTHSPNPKPQTLNPHPSPLTPKPSTLNPKP